MTPLSTLSIGVWPRSLRLRVLQAATPSPAGPSSRTLGSAAASALSEPEGSGGKSGPWSGAGG